jgi:hypothetical protein
MHLVTETKRQKHAGRRFKIRGVLTITRGHSDIEEVEEE